MKPDSERKKMMCQSTSDGINLNVLHFPFLWLFNHHLVDFANHLGKNLHHMSGTSKEGLNLLFKLFFTDLRHSRCCTHLHWSLNHVDSCRRKDLSTWGWGTPGNISEQAFKFKLKWCQCCCRHLMCRHSSVTPSCHHRRRVFNLRYFSFQECH